MTRMVRDFLETEDRVSLDRLIEQLNAVRDQLPEGTCDVEVRMRGDDLFGRHLTVTYLRPQTFEEAALDARYEERAPLRRVA